MSLRPQPDLMPSVGEPALSPVELNLAERIAAEVARRLESEPGTERLKLIDAGEVAGILGCDRSWVYEHQAELGAIRLGNGSRPRLRFDRERIAEIASAPRRTEGRPEPKRAVPRRRRAQRSPVPLLEIKRRR